MLRAAKEYYFNLRKNQWKNPDSLNSLKEDKLIKNIKYAYENIPFYNQKFKDAGLSPDDIKTQEDITKIPITTKNDILESNLSYISKTFNSDELYSSRTSGSTGEPFVSYFDKRGWLILKFASKYRARNACGFSFHEKFVIVEAMSVKEARKFNSNSNLSNLLIKKKFLSVYDTIESHVKFYLKFKPTTIYGFPSYFVNLVSYLSKNSIKLAFVKRIFTSSEVLDNSSRKIIENYFNSKVFDIYGSTEIKEVSWECPKHEGYHINEDLVYVECVDENGMPVQNGKEGQILMTSLENKAMPLIRYSIGDIGIILDEKCSCGRSFSLMKPVYGRSVDYFIMEDGRKISPYELTMSVEKIPNIFQYQITQKTKSLVHMSLKVNSSFSSKSKNQIISNLKKVLGNDVKIVLFFIDDFKKKESNNGKFRIVISEVKK